MTNTDTKDIKATVKQINELAKLGVDIVRIALPDEESAELVSEIKKQVSVPIVGDIHFDYRIAIKAIQNGIDAIRLNPGNITKQKYIEAIARECTDKQIPIRVGVNSGSLHRKYEKITPENLFLSAMSEIKILEGIDFFDIKVSIKASSVKMTVLANRLISRERNYPIHLGITEAGLYEDAVIKSAIGIGTLLLEDIGDTIRISITGKPHNEVLVGRKILQFAGFRNEGIEVISCPTCGRSKIDVYKLTKEVKEFVKNIKTNRHIKIAVMGCEVNGPKEAKESDIGIAGTENKSILFLQGKIVYKGNMTIAKQLLLEEIRRINESNSRCHGSKWNNLLL
jgi:(E)-4-hydroxy-3-methylbut-2-enyl-diphosphate synthase